MAHIFCVKWLRSQPLRADDVRVRKQNAAQATAPPDSRATHAHVVIEFVSR